MTEQPTNPNGQWVGSARRAELAAIGKDGGPNWYYLKGHTKKRAGGRCEAPLGDGSRCVEPGTDCDHIGDRSDHRPANLQWLCKVHHQIKTAQEATEARGSGRSSRHPGERHPSGQRFY